MAKNRTRDDARYTYLPVASGVKSGDPVIVGSITGVALTDRDASGKAALDLGGTYSIPVGAVNDSGHNAVAIGDELFFTTGDIPPVTKKASGNFFGYATMPVNSGQTANIEVIQVIGPGPGTLDILGQIGTDQIANGAVTRDKLASDAMFAMLLAAGFGNIATIAHGAGGSPKTILAANGPSDGDRVVMAMAICTEAINGATPATFEVGQTDAPDIFFDNATLAAATLGQVLLAAGTLSAAKDLIATWTAGAGPTPAAAGAFTFMVGALPVAT